ncbi:MAG: ketoacyl-ACP synthase III [Alphaproteobacteria bacterium]|nr:ketoacyl-ACP synthase III [Alphaproteobacteria bacterium]
MKSVVVGFGGALPQKCIKNDELPASLNTSDEWISQRTGIKQRYVIGEGESTSTLATKAAKEALDFAKVSPNDIDLIVVGTTTGDYTFPATACVVQKNLNITNGCPSFDVSAACSGFIYALDVADSFIRTRKAKHALVIGADSFSKILDWNDRASCVLFGDGAGAVVLKAEENTDKGVQYCKIYSDGSYTDFLITSGGVATTQASGVVTMKGREVFKFAVEKFCDSFHELLEQNNLTIDDIDLVVPHQANVRIINKLIDVLKMDSKKVVVTIDKHSNTSAATIPLALNEIKDTISTNKNIVLLSMGAGFTWGAALIRM